MSTSLTILQDEALALLKQLIAIPSFSKEEEGTAAVLEEYLSGRGVSVNRYMNNVWATNKYFDESKPSLLLNSHHDTVKPNKSYTLNPFLPMEDGGKLFGLGSNDAGGCLVALLAVFLHFYERNDLGYNLVFAATAEEEISGINGIEVLLHQLPPITCGIVGEPTQMQMAIAERGLLVLDVIAAGKAGHAARNEGENALYKALPDIEWFRNFKFDKVSPLLGEVKMTVTVMDTENKAHNVVPSSCHFVVDTRVNELYSFEEILETICANIKSDVKPRSLRMRSTSISMEHPLVKAGIELGRTYYGSPTTSDKALMPFQTLKMGPGDSARSHTADEYIHMHEIKEGIELYIELLKKVL
jgi:acetylornithine deacetylase/succinyl-diaminopimelate desuccinylase-like protein